MEEIKLTYVEPAEYFPKEIREKYFNFDEENEEAQKDKETGEDRSE